MTILVGNLELFSQLFEVVGIDRKNANKFLSFQELSARERGSKATMISLDSIKVDICVLAFDSMFVNGEKLLACPLRQRRQRMKDVFKEEKPGYFEYAKEITVEADEAREDCEATLTKINYFLEVAFQSSCEGIMIKSLDVDAGYFSSKRADSWLKVKRDYMGEMGDSLDLVTIGAWHGNWRKAGCGAEYIRKEVPLHVLPASSLLQLESPLSLFTDVQCVLYEEEKAAYNQAISQNIRDGKMHPLTFIHHTSTYQASMCKLMESCLTPAIEALEGRLQENEFRKKIRPRN